MVKQDHHHILEFDTSLVESYLLNEDEFEDPPYGLIENLREALELQKLGSYDSVLLSSIPLCDLLSISWTGVDAVGLGQGLLNS